ncbi:Thioredoxin-like protein [Pleurostoma richardsiae]|uniref:Glutathione S-transferase kappa 1 n=1 Tax=Pleurostoma richardsiae TaxID=41990 RepID=A0AA38VNH8_9PEZI|nr:Thioredoxin-like protein [Pleurostoma richardsiae]
MGGKIDCYIDLASFYSYLAFNELLRNYETLKAYGVEVEFHPVLLGGINAGSGNKPPWTLPAKAMYGTYDARRSCDRAGHPEIGFPEDLMSMSHTILPLRALHYIKRHYPRDVFETAFYYFFDRFWTPPHQNLSQQPVFTQALAEVPSGFKGPGTGDASRPVFSREEVAKILQAASTQEAKDLLKKTTQQALDQGAFGAPWLWVTNAEGKGEPFFGSDRFHFIYNFLGLPYQDVALLPPSGGKASSKL